MAPVAIENRENWESSKHSHLRITAVWPRDSPERGRVNTWQRAREHVTYEGRSAVMASTAQHQVGCVGRERALASQ